MEFRTACAGAGVRQESLNADGFRTRAGTPGIRTPPGQDIAYRSRRIASTRRHRPLGPAAQASARCPPPPTRRPTLGQGPHTR
eukprot:1976609-Pyramimonas_sp.AAC.1